MRTKKDILELMLLEQNETNRLLRNIHTMLIETNNLSNEILKFGEQLKKENQNKEKPWITKNKKKK